MRKKFRRLPCCVCHKQLLNVRPSLCEAWYHDIRAHKPLLSVKHYQSYQYNTTSPISTTLPLLSVQHYHSYQYNTTSPISTTLPLYQYNTTSPISTTLPLLSVQHYHSYQYNTTSMACQPSVFSSAVEERKN
jgi:hypothetical protein